MLKIRRYSQNSMNYRQSQRNSGHAKMPAKRNFCLASQIHKSDIRGKKKRRQSQDPQIHYQGSAEDQIIRNIGQHIPILLSR